MSTEISKETQDKLQALYDEYFEKYKAFWQFSPEAWKVAYEISGEQERRHKWLLRLPNGQPIYRERFQVICRVTRNVGYCYAGHKVGDEHVFGIRGPNPGICPGSLQSLMPWVRWAEYGGGLIASESDTPTVHSNLGCASIKNGVVWEVRKGLREPLFPTLEYITNPWVFRNVEDQNRASVFPDAEEWDKYHIVD